MFGRKSAEYDILPIGNVIEFEKAPQPDDSELPEIPASKTWRLSYYDKLSEEYTSSRLDIGGEWFTFTDITGYQWAYNGFTNTWSPKAITETVARVRIGYVIKYRLVKQ